MTNPNNTSTYSSFSVNIGDIVVVSNSSNLNAGSGGYIGSGLEVLAYGTVEYNKVVFCRATATTVYVRTGYGMTSYVWRIYRS